MKVLAFYGTMPERERLKGKLASESFDVILTTYDQLQAEVTYLRSRFFYKCVVLDEGIP